MGIVLTTTVGLVIWIILWSLDVSGLDAIMIAIVMVLIATAVRSVVPLLTGRSSD